MEVNIVKTHCQKFSQNLYDTRCIIKEGIWKAKKHLKRISTSLAIRKERSKHVLPLLHIRVAKANITDQNKVQVEKWRHCGLLMGAQDWSCLFGARLEGFLTSQNAFPQDSSVPP